MRVHRLSSHSVATALARSARSAAVLRAPARHPEHWRLFMRRIAHMPFIHTREQSEFSFDPRGGTGIRSCQSSATAILCRNAALLPSLPESERPSSANSQAARIGRQRFARARMTSALSLGGASFKPRAPDDAALSEAHRPAVSRAFLIRR